MVGLKPLDPPLQCAPNGALTAAAALRLFGAVLFLVFVEVGVGAVIHTRMHLSQPGFTGWELETDVHATSDW